MENKLAELAKILSDIEINQNILRQIYPENRLLTLADQRIGYFSQLLIERYPSHSEDILQKHIDIRAGYLADLRNAIRTEMDLREETEGFPDSLPSESIAA